MAEQKNFKNWLSFIAKKSLNEERKMIDSDLEL